MRFLKWAAIGAAFAAAGLLAACGGSGSGGGSANMRLINASAGYNSLDLNVNSKTVSTAVAYGAAGSYTSVDVASSTTQVIASGTTVIQTTPTLAADVKYSLIAYGWPNAMRTALLQEAEPAPASGYAKVLVLNLAPDAGAVNVYLTTGAPTTGAAAFATSVLGGSGSGYLQIAKGTYHVRVTGQASTDVNTDVRMDFDGFTVDDTSVNTLIITPTAGGVLVNAMSVVQQGAVKPYGGSNARVRVIDSVVGNPGVDAPVVASRGSTALLNSANDDAVGQYFIVPSGNDPINIAVNGVAMGARTDALVAGNDYTILVWGPISSPQVTIIADDNRLPSAGYAKVRLLNGAGDGLSRLLSIDLSAVASNIAPGTASTPVQIISSTSVSSSLEVRASNSSADVFTYSPFNIQNQKVYTVYMLGNSTKPGNVYGRVIVDR